MIAQKPVRCIMPFGSAEKKNKFHNSYEDFSIPVPEYYNFGFDVIDQWAMKDPAKPAMLSVNQEGQEK
jgi:acetyl-CoA synthetase